MPNDDGVRLALLSDSQATLRRVSGLLNEFSADSVSEADDDAGDTDDLSEAVTALVGLVRVTRVEISEVLAGLDRGLELLRMEAAGSADERVAAASALLFEIENRMARLSNLLDLPGAASGHAAAAPSTSD